MNNRRKYLTLVLLAVILLIAKKSFAAGLYDNHFQENVLETLEDFNFYEKPELATDQNNLNNNLSFDEFTYDNDDYIEINSKDNKRKIIFDSSGSVISADQFDIAYKLSNSEINTDNIKDKGNYINLILQKYIPNEYGIVDIEPILDGFYQLICMKNTFGVFNVYDSYKIILDLSSRTILGFKKCEDYIVTKCPEIDEDTAIEIAKNFCLNNGISVQNCLDPYVTVEVRRENDYFNKVDIDMSKEENIEEYSDLLMQKPLHTVLSVHFNDFEIFIDASSGDVIGADEKALIMDGASYFGFHNGETSTYFTGSASNINSILRSLGYKTSVANAQYRNGSDLRKFVRGDGNNYAFAYSGHANPTTLANNSSGNGYVKYLGLEDVNCCWKFVFLNGCRTAEDTRWRNAFGINANSSGKIFLGWYQKVNLGQMLSFTGYLKNKVQNYPNETFYSNLFRALQEPGPYCYIRFWGDKNITGKV